MMRLYKTQREPKNASSLAHAILTDSEFLLKSFQRNGHDMGCYHYEAVINGLKMAASVAPEFDASRCVDIFCEDHHLVQIRIEALSNCDFPKIAAAWLAVRPTPNGPGRVSWARANAVQLI
jgi:hypothetical protein